MANDSQIDRSEYMIVHKFGGTSVGNAERFACVADTVIGQQDKGRGSVVVVSAMSGVTNALIAGARAAAGGTIWSVCTVALPCWAN
jgi:aspartate kinase